MGAEEEGETGGGTKAGQPSAHGGVIHVHTKRASTEGGHCYVQEVLSRQAQCGGGKEPLQLTVGHQ